MYKGNAAIVIYIELKNKNLALKSRYLRQWIILVVCLTLTRTGKQCRISSHFLQCHKQSPNKRIRFPAEPVNTRETQSRYRK